MSDLPNCPQCNSEYTYIDGVSYICPECAFEWAIDGDDDEVKFIKDANGNKLQEGDMVTATKDLKVKGSSLVVKVGTKIKLGRIDTDAKDHEIDCKVAGVGAIKITAKFTKKV